MNVTVLAAVGVVRRRTRKKIGQAIAVDRTPTPRSEIAPSSAGVPGAPDSRATGSATSGAGRHHPGRELERLDVGEPRPREVAGDGIAQRRAQTGGDREDGGGTWLERRPADEDDDRHDADGQSGSHRAEIRWPMNPTAIAAVNSGVAAFRSAVNPAGSVTVATAISVTGTAENRAPDDQEGRHSTAGDRQRRRAGDGEQDRCADGETDLGRPRRPDLGRGDPEEEERRAPDRSQEQERSEVDDRE